MPAKSKTQQRLFGMVHAYKKGELDTSSISSSQLSKIKKIAGNIKDKDSKKFAKTKHKGLPEVKEGETPIKPKHQEKYKTLKPERRLKYLIDCGYSKGEIESWTGTRTTKSLGWEKSTDRKPKKIKETHKPTFKEFLVEMTLRDRKMLVPPPAIQKLYAQLKQKYGIVKRDVFYNQLADKLNLTPDGLRRLQQLPALRALPFDDQSQDEKPIVTRQDPWGHVTQKHTKREDRARQAGLNNW